MAKQNQLGRFVRCVREATVLESQHEAARYLTAQIFSPFSDFPQEELWVLTLDARHRATHEFMASRGTADSSLASPGIVFREAIALNASSIIVAHNHPSGDPDPSHADKLLTTRLREAGEILAVELIDHIIIGKGRWHSIVHDVTGDVSGS